MNKLEFKKPCNDCPWRRISLPGWLGSSTPEEFLATTLDEHYMPCHQTIDYEQDDWREKQLPNAPLCAGGLIFLRNICKMPRGPELAAAVREVEADRETVFAMPAEFVLHHGGGEDDE